MRKILCCLVMLAVAITVTACGFAQNDEGNPYDSGGPLLPEQAAYDVLFNDLTLRVDPGDSSIQGKLAVTARITSPIARFVLDLDPLLAVKSIAERHADGTTSSLPFERRGGRIWIAFRYMKQPREITTVEVAYGGKPRVAPRPPWDGGFQWTRTPGGAPWIATSCQGEGADLWWPCKDHPSDEPDSMALHLTVPQPLVVATNGRLRKIDTNADSTSTYHWRISTPINNYNVALNIAPYRVIERTYTSVTGETFPAFFWVLPEDSAKAAEIFPQFLEHLRFFEENLGPYPFRADKYGVVQTPHLGMEHQTIIAYGANFSNRSMTRGTDWGFDALHQHELSHEWWGNMVTNADWKDMWLHEGFGSYMQPLYAEKRQGIEGYHAYMNSMRRGISNKIPVTPRASHSADQIYGGDIYAKGAWVLHTLRFLIGEDKLRQALRRMAYPDPALERVTDGRQCRFATTDDFVHLAEEIAGMDLGWFFEVYVRQPALPKLVTRRDGDQLQLCWEVPGGLPFPMPVEVRIGKKIRRVAMPDGCATLTVKPDLTPEIDPDKWVLQEEK